MTSVLPPDKWVAMAKKETKLEDPASKLTWNTPEEIAVGPNAACPHHIDVCSHAPASSVEAAARSWPPASRAQPLTAAFCVQVKPIYTRAEIAAAKDEIGGLLPGPCPCSPYHFRALATQLLSSRGSERVR